MTTKHRYPTKKELEEGVTIKCQGSGDDLLAEMAAIHIRLQLVEALIEDVDDEDLDDNFDDDLDNEDEDNFLGYPDVELHPEELCEVRDLEEDDVELLLWVMARPPRRKHWFAVGVYGEYPITPWCPGDALLLDDYLRKLVKTRKLEAALDLPDDHDKINLAELLPEVDESAVLNVVSTAHFDRLLRESTMPLLVDFTAAWCDPCLRLKPVFADLAREHFGEIIFGKVDIDSNESLAKRFDVEAVPTVIAFRGGNKIGSIEGFEGKRAFLAWMKNVVG